MGVATITLFALAVIIFCVVLWQLSQNDSVIESEIAEIKRGHKALYKVQFEQEKKLMEPREFHLKDCKVLIRQDGKVKANTKTRGLGVKALLDRDANL